MRNGKVLILVLVEHALGAGECAAPFSGSSLNPCFSGTYSQRLPKPTSTSTTMRVLILVLVEHTLRVALSATRLPINKRLNPCFSGTYSQRGIDEFLK